MIKNLPNLWHSLFSLGCTFLIMVYSKYYHASMLSLNYFHYLTLYQININLLALLLWATVTTLEVTYIFFICACLCFINSLLPKFECVWLAEGVFWVIVGCP